MSKLANSDPQSDHDTLSKNQSLTALPSKSDVAFSRMIKVGIDRTTRKRLAAEQQREDSRKQEIHEEEEERKKRSRRSCGNERERTVLQGTLVEGWIPAAGPELGVGKKFRPFVTVSHKSREAGGEAKVVHLSKWGITQRPVWQESFVVNDVATGDQLEFALAVRRYSEGGQCHDVLLGRGEVALGSAHLSQERPKTVQLLFESESNQAGYLSLSFIGLSSASASARYSPYHSRARMRIRKERGLLIQGLKNLAMACGPIAAFCLCMAVFGAVLATGVAMAAGLWLAARKQAEMQEELQEQYASCVGQSEGAKGIANSARSESASLSNGFLGRFWRVSLHSTLTRQVMPAINKSMGESIGKLYAGGGHSTDRSITFREFIPGTSPPVLRSMSLVPSDNVDEQDLLFHAEWNSAADSYAICDVVWPLLGHPTHFRIRVSRSRLKIHGRLRLSWREGPLAHNLVSFQITRPGVLVSLPVITVLSYFDKIPLPLTTLLCNTFRGLVVAAINGAVDNNFYRPNRLLLTFGGKNVTPPLPTHASSSALTSSMGASISSPSHPLRISSPTTSPSLLASSPSLLLHGPIYGLQFVPVSQAPLLSREWQVLYSDVSSGRSAGCLQHDGETLFLCLTRTKSPARPSPLCAMYIYSVPASAALCSTAPEGWELAADPNGAPVSLHVGGRRKCLLSRRGTAGESPLTGLAFYESLDLLFDDRCPVPEETSLNGHLNLSERLVANPLTPTGMYLVYQADDILRNKLEAQARKESLLTEALSPLAHMATPFSSSSSAPPFPSSSVSLFLPASEPVGASSLLRSALRNSVELMPHRQISLGSFPSGDSSAAFSETPDRSTPPRITLKCLEFMRAVITDICIFYGSPTDWEFRCCKLFDWEIVDRSWTGAHSGNLNISTRGLLKLFKGKTMGKTDAFLCVKRLDREQFPVPPITDIKVYDSAAGRQHIPNGYRVVRSVNLDNAAVDQPPLALRLCFSNLEIAGKPVTKLAVIHPDERPEEPSVQVLFKTISHQSSASLTPQRTAAVYFGFAQVSYSHPEQL
ncbi:MAG: hypothetical protein Q8P67_01115 [archaeon]|nr:hypothetical protein [archaeon]